jgi:hypothetical protein
MTIPAKAPVSKPWEQLHGVVKTCHMTVFKKPVRRLAQLGFAALIRNPDNSLPRHWTTWRGHWPDHAGSRQQRKRRRNRRRARYRIRCAYWFGKGGRGTGSARGSRTGVGIGHCARYTSVSGAGAGGVTGQRSARPVFIVCLCTPPHLYPIHGAECRSVIYPTACTKAAPDA